MLRERLSKLKRLLLSVDFLTILLAFITAYYLRYFFREFYKVDLFKGPPIMPRLGPLSDYILVALFISSIWVFLLLSMNYYNPWRLRSRINTFYISVKAGVGTFILTVFTFFLLHQSQLLSRILLSLSILLGIVLLNLERWFIIKYLSGIRRKTLEVYNILLAGGNGTDRILEREINSRPELGFRIVGKLTRDGKGDGVIGGFSDLEEILKSSPVDEVIFTGRRTDMKEIEGMMDICELQGINSSIAVDFLKRNIYRIAVNDLFGIPMINLSTLPPKTSLLFLKRVMDITLSFIGLLLLSPLLLFTALGIKLTSRGDVFYRQERVTLNGRRFLLFKFRSMIQDAERRKSELLPFNEMSGPVFKMKGDPRVTRFGRFIRRYSIDELPQLFNVLMGDMSLVGPRPPIPEEVNRYEIWQKRRLSMKPGITCLWQVSGRNEIDFDEWMKMDLRYLDNWSLWLDISILLKTIPVVISAKGAR